MDTGDNMLYNPSTGAAVGHSSPADDADSGSRRNPLVGVPSPHTQGGGHEDADGGGGASSHASQKRKRGKYIARAWFVPFLAIPHRRLASACVDRSLQSPHSTSSVGS